MSKFEIKMPKLGESITEGTIVSLNIKLGDLIEEDQILFEVTTAKVNAEVPSPVSGKVVEILYNEGDTADVGKTVLIIDMDGEDAVVTDSSSETTSEQTAVTPEKTQVEEKAVDSEPAEVVPEPQDSSLQTREKTVAAKAESDRWYSPVVMQLAKQASISAEELDTIQGTGYLGRLSKKDIKNYIENKGSQSQSVQPKKLRPVEKPMQEAIKTATSDTSTYSATNMEVKDMDAVGKIIADRMVLSKQTSAHVTTVVEVDVTKLVNWRKKKKDAFQKQEGINLTYLPAIVQATVKALKDYPKLNASVDGYKYILKKDINIGIAVALEDENLVVPVVHHADKLSISGIAQAIENLSTKARSNKLTMPDIENGTFTITKFGTFKNINGTPIINQPEVAILGVGYIEKKPAVVETPEGDMIAIRHKMYLSLSYDHRLINGAVGGAFLLKLANYLENWSEN